MAVSVSMSAAIIAVCMVCTIAERAFPFLLFRGKDVPSYIKYLGAVLPMAIMCTLVFYCLRNVTFDALANWIPQTVSALVTVGLHLWRRNTLLSILGGTICCMVLMQFVF